MHNIYIYKSRGGLKMFKFKDILCITAIDKEIKIIETTKDRKNPLIATLKDNHSKEFDNIYNKYGDYEFIKQSILHDEIVFYIKKVNFD